MSIIDNYDKFDRILGSTNLNEYASLLTCQSSNLVTVCTSIQASELLGLKGVKQNFVRGVDPCQGFSLSPPLCDNELEIASMQPGSGRGMVT